MFDENSGLVRIWVNLVQAGTYTGAEVPPISNLQEVVKSVLEGGENT
ncbi:hypothetical protein RWV98_05905 [Agathobaculum sp. NTUH-O15-33]|nr:hypothetical protein [Agathobaculum sp. NTUH-O15-33]WNX85802.1 hypothetical protein RWV98_05905 [Agathobaculum sp. NTUH-O15-33]